MFSRLWASAAVSLTMLSGCGGGGGTAGGGGQTYTLSGTVSGLSGTELVLLNNGAYATTVSANATQFTMPTAVAHGASYDITVGLPYGSHLACTVANGQGTVSGPVNTVSIQCTPTAATQKVIASYFANPYGVAVDANGNVFVADGSSNAVKEIPYSHGGYGTPVTVGPAIQSVFGVAVDASGNLFVVAQLNDAVEEIPYDNGAYGPPVVIGSVLIGSAYGQPSGMAVDASGNVFFAAWGGSEGVVAEIPYSNGHYGATVTLGSGFGQDAGLAVDANGNVWVADTFNDSIKKIPYSNGGYGTPAVVVSGNQYLSSMAVDASDDLFVMTSDANVEEIPNNHGSYGTPVILDNIPDAVGVALDSKGNIFVSGDNAVTEFPYSSGSYGTPISLVSGFFANPSGVAADAGGNVFVSDKMKNIVAEIPFNSGNYGTPTVIGSGFNDPLGVGVDGHGNVFVLDSGNNAVKEIPLANGAYGTPVSIASGLNTPSGIAVDILGNVFVLDTVSSSGGTVLKEIPYTGGKYGALVTFGSETFHQLSYLAVDLHDNLFVMESPEISLTSGAVEEIPYSNGGFGTPLSILSGLTYVSGGAVDAGGNVFVTDNVGAGEGTFTEILNNNGNYGKSNAIQTPTSSVPDAAAVDLSGRLYVLTTDSIAVIGP